jgi:hypothetical protein
MYTASPATRAGVAITPAPHFLMIFGNYPAR